MSDHPLYNDYECYSTREFKKREMKIFFCKIYFHIKILIVFQPIHTLSVSSRAITVPKYGDNLDFNECFRSFVIGSSQP